MADRLSHGRVIKIAGPIVLSNATVPILGAVDTGVVGQMGLPEPIGAVGLGALILTSIYWIFGFLRMGTTGFVAQALGRGDRDSASATLGRALFVGGMGGLLVLILHPWLIAGAFWVSPATAEVETLARDYMAIRVWSAPALIGLYAVTGYLVAAERTGAVLILQLWMNGLNIALDLWFVLGLGWGVEGVAIATLLAEVTGFGLGIWFCKEAFDTPAWRDRARILDPERLARFAQVNADILIRSLMLQAIFVSFLVGFAPGFGVVVLAATQILMQFFYIASYAMDGFAYAAETLVGRAVGAKDRQQVRRATLISGIWCAAVGAAMTAIIFAFGPRVIDLMTTAPEVREAARAYLPYTALSALLGAAAFLFDGVFIGATRTRDMRNMMIVSAAIYFAAAAVLLPTLGAHGLWLALLISFVARGLSLGLRYPALERGVETSTESVRRQT